MIKTTPFRQVHLTWFFMRQKAGKQNLDHRFEDLDDISWKKIGKIESLQFIH